MLSKLKKIFKREQKIIEPDRVKNEISFTDLNKTEVVVSIKHIDSENYLFIKVRDSDDFILLDRESSILVQAMLTDFIKNGNIKQVTKLIGDK